MKFNVILQLSYLATHTMQMCVHTHVLGDVNLQHAIYRLHCCILLHHHGALLYARGPWPFSFSSWLCKPAGPTKPPAFFAPVYVKFCHSAHHTEVHATVAMLPHKQPSSPRPPRKLQTLVTSLSCYLEQWSACQPWSSSYSCHHRTFRDDGKCLCDGDRLHNHWQGVGSAHDTPSAVGSHLLKPIYLQQMVQQSLDSLEGCLLAMCTLQSLAPDGGATTVAQPALQYDRPLLPAAHCAAAEWPPTLESVQQDTVCILGT